MRRDIDDKRRDFIKTSALATVGVASGAVLSNNAFASGHKLQSHDNLPLKSDEFLPLRQNTEFGTLREVILGRTQRAGFPPKSPANANFTDKIEDLGPDFYDAFEEGAEIPISDVKPELVDAYDKLHMDLTKAYESEGVIVQRTALPTKEILDYFGFRPFGYWPFTIANFWQIFGNVIVETSTSDNIMGCAAATFTGRDLLMERYQNDPNAILMSALPAMPSDGVKDGKGPGPFITCGDIRLIDDENVLVGVGRTKGKSESSASDELGVETLRRMLSPFGYKVHQIDYDANYSFHFDYVLGLVAPGVACTPHKAYIGGIPKVLKDWDLIDISRDECGIHGAGNIVPLGPNSSGKHRVVVPMKTERVSNEIEKRGVRAVPVEVELGARHGGGIRCATLVTNRDD